MGLKQKMKKSLLAIDINLLLDSERMKREQGERLLGADMRMTCNKR